MSKKHHSNSPFVYSTNPDAMPEEDHPEQETLPPQQQRLKVVLDSKHRAGKIVTLVNGFIGKASDLESLGKVLKTKCGTGGSAKDQQVILQGDYKARVIQLLQQMKYNVNG